jgi:hypothetical protein
MGKTWGNRKNDAKILGKLEENWVMVHQEK